MEKSTASHAPHFSTDPSFSISVPSTCSATLTNNTEESKADDTSTVATGVANSVQESKLDSHSPSSDINEHEIDDNNNNNRT